MPCPRTQQRGNVPIVRGEKQDMSLKILHRPSLSLSWEMSAILANYCTNVRLIFHVMRCKIKLIHYSASEVIVLSDLREIALTSIYRHHCHPVHLYYVCFSVMDPWSIMTTLTQSSVASVIFYRADYHRNCVCKI